MLLHTLRGVVAGWPWILGFRLRRVLSIYILGWRIWSGGKMLKVWRRDDQRAPNILAFVIEIIGYMDSLNLLFRKVHHLHSI